MAPEAKIAATIRPIAFFGEKSNSPAAWGTLSKPTNAHGANATITAIAANGDTSAGKPWYSGTGSWRYSTAVHTRMMATAAIMITQA